MGSVGLSSEAENEFADVIVTAMTSLKPSFQSYAHNAMQGDFTQGLRNAVYAMQGKCHA